MSEQMPMTNSKVLKTRGITLGPYMMQSPPKCTPYPPVYGYMYTSGPKAVGHTERQRKSRPLRKSDRGLLPGEYFNTMYDPRVYRGKTFQDFKETERERCIKAEKQEERREIIKKRKSLRANQYKLGGIVRPKTPPPKNRNLDREATQLFLIEHLEKIAEINQLIQTEVEQAPIPIPDYLKIKSGISTGTQIDDWELFDFEEEIGAIAPVLTERIVEQAVTEVMEEDEQLFVRGVWVTAQQKLHVAQSHMEILKNQEKEFAIKAETRRLQLHQEEMNYKDLEENVACIFFAQSYLSQMTNHLSDVLHKAGTLYDMSYEAIKSEFQPWLSKQVRDEVTRTRIATSLLDDIIIMIVKYRAAAVLGDLGLEIDFMATSADTSLTHICRKRDIVISDSNASSEYGEVDDEDETEEWSTHEKPVFGE